MTIEPDNISFRASGIIRFYLSKKAQLQAAKLVLISNNSTSIPIRSGTVNEYSLKSLGKFKLQADTTGPKIKTSIPVKKLKKVFKNQDHLSFVITDNLSGIGRYSVFINDKWVLAEYDAKSDLLTYFFDSDTPGGQLNVMVVVLDKVGNSSVYKLNLQR